ncbi:MAG: hemerythrin domain-containing protein [Candidatus Obscuribacter sp.]|jgi:hemerythrin superfamily protein|nr:hemerythrin domain-containing protein [Candidatus Obscuribacter sp.]MBK7840690.1 hemerythrin domain-containing protein [Candidatus Obscuribacter sp.]MBK9206721.1 hemerythrin domain-containing protein [Candidatus Obscuribacter sp.]MBK9620907.1 hemerythrin domain-containing protein [Candidatus Obscuribacter sp.]MBK9771363.1 hemerythrin domain-containing protein [Candidatus Obscuribacter sp.]
MPARTKSMDITVLLHEDHQLVRELFFAFSKAEEDAEKEKLVKQILTELFIHAKVEEEIVYPLLDEEGKDGEEFKGEAENEHKVVKYMMAEIANLESNGDELKSKMTVLCELIEHHVKEEEKEMFEMLRESGQDLAALADEAMERKNELKKEGLPAMKSTLKVGDEVIVGEAEDEESDSPEDDEDASNKQSAKDKKDAGGKLIRAKSVSAPRKLPTQKPKRKSA